MVSFIAALLFAVTPADTQAAYADLAQRTAEQKHYTGYVSFSSSPADKLEKRLAVGKVVICSLSRNPHLPSQLPQRLEGTSVLRLDLYALGWKGPGFDHWGNVLIKHYPFDSLTRQGQYPWIVDGDWLVSQLTDPVETPGAHDLLLYGKEFKNIADVLAFWKVQADQELFWGYLEGASGVSIRKARTLENRPSGNRGYAWVTKDFENFDAKTDPLENLIPGTNKFDASEYIFGLPKYSHGKLGMLQVYDLSDDKGNRQAKAPAAIVADHMQTRGVEIRNWVSCIACHPTGITDPTRDEYRQYLTAGIKDGEATPTLKAYDLHSQAKVEAYLENDVVGEMERNRQLYAAGIEMVCGLKPEAFAAAYVETVKDYDSDVTLERAAKIRGATVEELQKAIAWQSTKGGKVSKRVAQLASGVAMPVDRYEQEDYLLEYYVQEWRGRK